ncbi:hypothetical protein K461DRAFT_230937 [Myriangium duriaei CBS 260.36]|uniref:Uncharacterized protein n=1 Tax=Myriangium duriaei CBS 260.36 TaxID=1168546 RepID=A0A9P4MH39_9PEZI|nr:hypothetical protein K461DRAFT_230937 [Myriangium duriaei CBS 260.36]
MATPNSPAARRWILTIGVAVITVSGAYLGANLKADQDIRRERRSILEATPQEQMKLLESQRSKLVAQKTELEKKLAEIMERQRRSAGESKG